MRITILSAFALNLLSACTVADDHNDTTPKDKSDVAPATASLRVAHLSPDAPAVDVFIDGVAEPVVTGLAFSEGTEYLEVPAGTYTFKVAPAGAGVEAAVLTIADLSLAADSFSTAVAYDEVASITAAALSDETTGLADGSFRVNVMHAAPGVGEVDIWALADGGASPLLENVPFGADASLDLPAGAYRVGFDVDNDANPDVTFALPELQAGSQVNLYATNNVDGDVFLLAHLSDGTVARIDPEAIDAETAYVRVLHLSPDAPAVDVYVDGIADPVVTDLMFGDGSEYLEVPAGTYTFRVAPANTSARDAVLVVNDLPLSADTRYTAVAWDQLSEIAAVALVDNDTGIASGTFRAQVVHAASAVGQVDIWEVSGTPTPLIVDFDRGTSVTTDLPVSAYNLGVDVNNDASPDLTFTVPPLADGSANNVFAVNDAEGAVYLLAQLADGSMVRIDPN
jgi:hypothetical protein